jgi:hypothetical protein
MLNFFSTRSSNHRLGTSPTNSKFWRLVATVIFALSSAGVCAQSFTETFENPLGTDNNYDTMVAPGNLLNPNFSSPALPYSWGKKSGEIFLGPDGGRGAFWMKHDASASPNGYFFTGSFFIALDDRAPGETNTLFISKPMDWTAPLAAWRLYYIEGQGGKVNLVLIVGWNSVTNNPSAALYSMPINIKQAYDVAINYDTAHRFYSWSVDGKVQAASKMPSDYPLIGTEIIGSSGSASGHDTAFIVDNITWRDLSGQVGTMTSLAAIPEPGSWLLLCCGFLVLRCGHAVRKWNAARQAEVREIGRRGRAGFAAAPIAVAPAA